MDLCQAQILILIENQVGLIVEVNVNLLVLGKENANGQHPLIEKLSDVPSERAPSGIRWSDLQHKSRRGREGVLANRRLPRVGMTIEADLELP